MARRPFGGGGDAVVLNYSTGAPVPYAQVTFWNARSGGSRYMDVADTGGSTFPSSTLTADPNGAIPPFLGPVDGTAQMWADAGNGRFLLDCTDLPTRVATLEGDAGALDAIEETLLNAAGDLVVASAADTADRLGVGTDGQVLTVDTAQTLKVKWASPAASGIQATTIDAKGDLLVGTAADTVARMGVGSDGHMLYVDSTQAAGIKWAAPPSGTGIPPTTVDAKGDLIVATAADTVGRLAVGSNNQVLTADSSQATGLKWATPASGGSGGTPLVYYVAASDASAAEKAKAAAVCDGTADNVEIQAAIAACKGVGIVQLSAGTFYLAAQLTLYGDDDVDVENNHILRGAGSANTMIVVGSGLASGIHISKSALVHLSDFRLSVTGASHGISAAYSGVSASGYRSFWMSSMKNIQVVGPFDGTHSGYAFHLGSFFRSVFENLETVGIGNGIRIFSENANFNPGDSTFTRCFMDCMGNNRKLYSIESTLTGAIMNQLEFVMCEGIADGTGCVGFYFGGAEEVVSIKAYGVNLEQVDTCVQFNNAHSCHIDGNYWELRYGATSNTTQLIRFETNARNNWVKNVGYWYTEGVVRCILSTATDTGQPNLVEHVKMIAATGCNITNSIATAGAVVRKWIVGEGSGTIGSGVLVTPA